MMLSLYKPLNNNWKSRKKKVWLISLIVGAIQGYIWSGLCIKPASVPEASTLINRCFFRFLANT